MSHEPINVTTPTAVVLAKHAKHEITDGQLAEYLAKRIAYERTQSALEERQRKESAAAKPAASRPPVEYAIGTKRGLVVRGSAMVGAKNYKPREYLATLANADTGLAFVTDRTRSGAMDDVVASGKRGEAFKAANPDTLDSAIGEAVVGCLLAAAKHADKLTPADLSAARATVADLADWVADQIPQPEPSVA